MTPQDEVFNNAAKALIRGVQLRASMTPREAAEAAWYPGHRLKTVEAIEAKIIADRAALAAAQAGQQQAA